MFRCFSRGGMHRKWLGLPPLHVDHVRERCLTWYFRKYRCGEAEPRKIVKNWKMRRSRNVYPIYQTVYLAANKCEVKLRLIKSDGKQYLVALITDSGAVIKECSGDNITEQFGVDYKNKIEVCDYLRPEDSYIYGEMVGFWINVPKAIIYLMVGARGRRNHAMIRKMLLMCQTGILNHCRPPAHSLNLF